MPYEYLEDVTTSDVAFEAWGADLEETFRAAADATMNVMIDDLASIELRRTIEIELENNELDLLLFDFLGELIYFKDAEQLLLRITDLEIVRDGGSFRLRGTARGENLDPDRHRQLVDVKAVTLHNFRLEQTPRGWRAVAILDI